MSSNITLVSEIVVITLIAIAVGLIIWAADKRHTTYGLVLPPAVAVITALFTWIIMTAVGVTATPWAWVAWVVGIGLGTAVAVAVCVLFGRNRTRYDHARMAAVLKQYR